MTAALGALLVGGVYADGWAHLNVVGLESFFTPWHAVLYGGFVLLGAWMTLLVLLRRTRTSQWLVPTGFGGFLLEVGARESDTDEEHP